MQYKDKYKQDIKPIIDLIKKGEQVLEHHNGWSIYGPTFDMLITISKIHIVNDDFEEKGGD